MMTLLNYQDFQDPMAVKRHELDDGSRLENHESKEA